MACRLATATLFKSTLSLLLPTILPSFPAKFGFRTAPSELILNRAPTTIDVSMQSALRTESPAMLGPSIANAPPPFRPLFHGWAIAICWLARGLISFWTDRARRCGNRRRAVALSERRPG